MLQIIILMVGKTRQTFIREGINFYARRLAPFYRLSLESVREEKESVARNPQVLARREGERLRGRIPPKAYVVALDPGGRECTSEEFAAWLGEREADGRPLVFLLGGHFGLDEQLLAVAQEKLALSRLTFTHELSRLVLLEQLYRAKAILRGHPYHV